MRCCQFKGCNDSVPASGDCRSMTYDTMRALGHTTNVKCILWIWLIGFFAMPWFFSKKLQSSAITRFSAPISQLLLMMSWQLMARRMKIRGHLLRVVCRVELCCGVLHYVVLCGRILEGTTILALLGFQQKGDERRLLFGGECSSWHDDAPNTHLNTHFLSSTSYLLRNTNKVFKRLVPSCAGGNNDIHLVWPVVHWSLH